MRNSLMLQMLFSVVAGVMCPPVLAATFTVNSILDTPDTNPGDGVCEATSGGVQCTLRAAIQEANANATFDVIEFGLGLITINITASALPEITTSLRIDGRTAPSYNAAATNASSAPPSVYIDGGSLINSFADGFKTSTTANVEIYAIGITNFPDNGIELAGNQSGTIDSNWIGVGRNGSIAGNGTKGVYLNSASNCTIGKKIVGFAPAVIQGRGNVISNNGSDGVHVILGSGNNISGNVIGGDPLGSAELGNGRHGVFLQGPDNIIGEIGTGNLIAHNNSEGIRAELGGQSIRANYIWNNSGSGVVLNGGGSEMGSSLVGSSNVLEANGGSGVLVGPNVAAPDTVIWNNSIFANAGRGVHVTNGNGSVLVSNDISMNGNDGIRMDSSNGSIGGNRIGASGGDSGNSGDGIVVNGSGNTISNNDIGAQTGDGIDVISGSNVVIQNNRIGSSSTFQDVGNGANGIRIRVGVTGTRVENNLIGHNGSHGIRDEGSNSTQILLNRIGSGQNGENVGNGGSGIELTAAAAQTQVVGNTIGHNLLDGIYLQATGATICGNYIGVGQGYQDAGNAVEGINVLGPGNYIGYSPSIACGGNVIGFNKSDGIQVNSASNFIRNNAIGGQLVSGQVKNFGNTQGGVLLTTGSEQNDIRSNTIRSNGSHGIRVSTTAGTQNEWRLNDFKANGGMAVDLNLDGPTANDPGDGDSGPNNLQNTPEFDQVQVSGSGLQVIYRINSANTNSAYPISVQFYVSADNDGEGDFTFLQSYFISPNAQRTALFSPPLESGYVAAIATDANGNSSEMSIPVAFAAAPQSEVIFADSYEPAE